MAIGSQREGTSPWAQDFSRTLGHSVEACVGRQLREAGHLPVLGEITYDGHKNIDWIWIHPQAVFLFEVKFARMTKLAAVAPSSATWSTAT